MKSVLLAALLGAAAASESNGLEPAIKTTVGDSAINKLLAKTLPTLQDTINDMLHQMDPISTGVLTLTLNVGPFNDCNIEDLTSITTAFSASKGLSVNIPFALDCSAPYSIVEWPHITVAHGTMTLTSKKGAYIHDDSSITSDGLHLIIGSGNVDVSFVPEIKFSGLVGSLLTAVLKVFQPLIKVMVDDAIEKAVNEGIETLNAEVLQALPIQVGLAPLLEFDSALPYAVTAQDTFTLGIDGTFQEFGQSFADKSNPFTVEPLVDEVTADAKDFQFAISDYTFLTLLYSLQMEGKLDYTIPADKLKLTTTYLAPIAPRMSVMYPGDPVQLRLYVATGIDSSAFVTQEGHAVVTLPLSMEFDPIAKGGPQPGFTILTTAQFGLSLSVGLNASAPSQQLLQGDITTLDLGTPVVAASAVGTVNANLLISLVDAAMSVAVNMINQELNAGFALPPQLVDTSIQMTNTSTRVATDIDLDALADLLATAKASPKGTWDLN